MVDKFYFYFCYPTDTHTHTFSDPFIIHISPPVGNIVLSMKLSVCYDLTELNLLLLSVQSRENGEVKKKKKKEIEILTKQSAFKSHHGKNLRSTASRLKYEMADCPCGNHHCSYINSSADEHCSFGVSMLHVAGPFISSLLIATVPHTLLQCASVRMYPHI